MGIRIVKKKAGAAPPAPAKVVQRGERSSNRSDEARTVPPAERELTHDYDVYLSNPQKYRGPEPSECKVCHWPYAFPCHGKRDNCMNAKWARGEAQGEKIA